MKKNTGALTSGAFAEALVKSCGFIDEEFDRPLIAVINSWNELHPGHCHLRHIAEAVKTGVRIAGGTAFECGTIALCDGLRSMRGQRNFLPSREVIADSIELLADTYEPDGLVLISTCDKIEPANLMAAARLNIPTVIVTGGAMAPGNYRGRDLTTDDVVAAQSGFWNDQILSDEDRQGIIDNIYETCGGCTGMGTANTMACLIEAMGMSLPDMACTMAVDSKKIRLAKRSGIAVVDLVKRGIRARDVMSRAAIYNALRVNEAIGGSTNTFLHLPAIAHELGWKLDIEEFDRIGKETPHICDIIPSGPVNMLMLRNAGGIQAVMKELESMLDLSAITVTGKTIRENLMTAGNHDQGIIRSVTNPISPCGGHAVLKGSLAPEGCVIKQVACPAAMRSHKGPAQIFDCSEDALMALNKGEIKSGSVIVIRYEGPRGGPGMREMLDITRALYSNNLHESVAVVTDGRFSGYSKGAVFGHVSPEAQVGGPIALIRNGDIIKYNIEARSIDIELNNEELERRLREWTPKKLDTTGYLRRYAQMVSSSTTGAVCL